MTKTQANLGDWDTSKDLDCLPDGSGCLPSPQVIDVEVSCCNL